MKLERTAWENDGDQKVNAPAGAPQGGAGKAPTGAFSW